MTTPLDRPAMHIASAFTADAAQDPDGVAVRRCPACSTGNATFSEDARGISVSCSTGCTPHQITTALYESRYPVRLPIVYPPTTEGICERCNTRTRVRAVRLEDGLEHVCESCHPAESTEPTPEG